MTKKELIENANKKHQKKINEVANEETLKHNLLVNIINILGKEVSVVNSKLISLRTTREEAQEILSCFKDLFAPVKILNGEYTTYSDKDKDWSYLDIFPVTANVNQRRVSLSYGIIIDGKKVSVLHGLTDAVSRISVEEKWDKYERGEKLYSNCRLVTAVDSNVQVYGTHADGLHQYTMWWNYNDKYGEDFKEVFSNTFSNALMVL